MARALLALDGAFTGIELMPTARAVQESAISAAWLLLTEGSEKTMPAVQTQIPAPTNPVLHADARL